MTEVLPDLKVEIREALTGPGSPLPYQEFADLYDRQNSTGICTHRTIRLRPDRRFVIRVFVGTNFDWDGGNAIKLRVDFDAGTKVKEVDAFILRDHDPAIWQAKELEWCTGGHEVYIESLIRQLPHNCEQKFRFMTKLIDHPASDSDRDPPKHQSSVTVALARYVMLASDLPTMPHRIPLNKVKKGFKSDDILTSIELCDQTKVRRSTEYNLTMCQMPKGKSSDYDKIYHFHYRTPEIYKRMVEEDEAHHQYEPDGNTKTKVTTPSTAPSTTPSSNAALAVSQNDGFFIPQDDQPTTVRNESIEDTIEVMAERQSSILNDEVESDDERPTHHDAEVDVDDTVAPDATADSAYGSAGSDTAIGSVEDENTGSDEVEVGIRREKMVQNQARSTNKLLKQLHSQDSNQQVLDSADAFIDGWYHKGKRPRAYSGPKKNEALTVETRRHGKKARIMQQGRETSEQGRREKVKQSAREELEYYEATLSL